MKKIMVFALIAVIIIGGFIGYSFFNKSMANEVTLYSVSSGEKPMHINLDGRGIAKVNLIVEHPDKEKMERIDNNVYMLRDSVNRIIGKESLDELGNLDIERLKDEIAESVSELYNIKDPNIYYQDFVIQK